MKSGYIIWMVERKPPVSCSLYLNCGVSVHCVQRVKERKRYNDTINASLYIRTRDSSIWCVMLSFMMNNRGANISYKRKPFPSVTHNSQRNKNYITINGYFDYSNTVFTIKSGVCICRFNKKNNKLHFYLNGKSIKLTLYDCREIFNFDVIRFSIVFSFQ